MDPHDTLICLDPGHGGRDPGAVSPLGLTEAEVVLDISEILSHHLEAEGFDVLRTRSSDVYVGLTERAQRANREGAGLFVSIHCNSAEVPTSGIETYAARRSPRGPALAESIQQALCSVQFPQASDRGVKRADFTVLTKTKMPAVLVECEFLHTPCGDALLRERSNRIRFASGIAAGIRAFLGVAPLPPVVDPPEPPAHPAAELAGLVERHARALLEAAGRYV